MSIGRALSVVLLLVTAAESQSWSEHESVVVAAVDQVDPVSFLVSRHSEEGLSAWLIAEVLFVRGRPELAVAFAQELASSATAEKLKSYCDSRKSRSVSRDDALALVRANRLRLSNQPSKALGALPPVRPGHSVLAFLRSRERGIILHDLDRPDDGDAAFLDAARTAGRIGWWTGATATLRRVVFRHMAGRSNRFPSWRLTFLRSRIRSNEAMLIYTTVFDEVVCIALTRTKTVMLMVGTTSSLRDGLLQGGGFLPPSSGSLWPDGTVDRLRASLLRPLAALPPVSHIFVVPEWNDLIRVPFSVVAPKHTISNYEFDMLFQFRGSRRRAGTGVLVVKPRSAPELVRKGLESRTPLDSERVDGRELKRTVGARRWRTIHITAEFDRRRGVLLRPDREDLIRVADLLHVKTDLLVLSASRSGLALDRRRGLFRSLKWVEVLGAVGEEGGAAALAEASDTIEQGDGRGLPMKALLLAPECRACLVHLWRRDREAAQALIRKFYEYWGREDASDVVAAARSLRRAQSHVRSRAKWKSPYYWAGWQLWGITE